MDVCLSRGRNQTLSFSVLSRYWALTPEHVCLWLFKDLTLMVQMKGVGNVQ